MSNLKGEEPQENLDQGVEEINEDDGESAKKEEDDEVRLVSPEEEEGVEEGEGGVEADIRIKRKGKDKRVEPKRTMISKFKKMCFCGSNSSRKKMKTEKKKKKKDLSSSTSPSSPSPSPFPLLYDPEEDAAAALGCYRCFNSAKKPSTVYYGFVKYLLENNDFYSEECNAHRYIPRPAAEKG